MVLVNSKTRKVLGVGSKITIKLEGEPLREAEIIKICYPYPDSEVSFRKSGGKKSLGSIRIDAIGDTWREFYPHVLGCEFVDESGLSS